jgi:hypothetical protein
MQTYRRIAHVDLKWPEESHVSPEARDFVARLLRFRPSDRLPLSRVKDHIWIRQHQPQAADATAAAAASSGAIAAARPAVPSTAGAAAAAAAPARAPLTATSATAAVTNSTSSAAVTAAPVTGTGLGGFKAPVSAAKVMALLPRAPGAGTQVAAPKVAHPASAAAGGAGTAAAMGHSAVHNENVR